MLELLQDILYHLDTQDDRFKDHNILTEDEMYRHGQLKKKVTRGIIQQLSRTIFEQFVTPPINFSSRLSSASTEENEQESLTVESQEIQKSIPAENPESIQNGEFHEGKETETFADIDKDCNKAKLTYDDKLEVSTFVQNVVQHEFQSVDDTETTDTFELTSPENADFVKEPMAPIEEKIRLEIIPADEFESCMSIGEQVIVSNSDEGFSEDDLMGTYLKHDYETIDETPKGLKEENFSKDALRLNAIITSPDEENTVPIHELSRGQDDLFNTLNFAEENDLIYNVMDSDNQENASVLNAEKINGLFSCKVCKVTFRYRHGLLRHSRIHTGEKPFKCLLCQSTFSRKDTLETHHRVHTGEKPFECTACGKKFAQRSSLRGHLIIHPECKVLHNKKPYNCKICRARFTKRGGLNSHIKRKHAEDKKTESQKKILKPKRKIQLRSLTDQK